MNYVLYGLVLFLLCLSICDYITTEDALEAGAVEANPIMAWFQRVLGAWWWVIKVAIVVPFAVFAVYEHHVDWIDLVVVSLIDAGYCYVVWNNYSLSK